MPDFRQHYEVTASVANFIANINRGKTTAQGFESAISLTDEAVVGFNESLSRFTGGDRIISGQEALNRVGAITEEQYKRITRVFDELIKNYGEGSFEANQLAAQQQKLARSLGQVTKALREKNAANKGEQTDLDALNALGVKSAEQYAEQFAEIERLRIAFADDEAATAGLILKKEELIESLSRQDQATRNAERSTKLSQFTLLNTGFLIQDLSTLSQGWAFALRAIANNIDITVRSFGNLIRQQQGIRGAFRQLGRDLLSPGGFVAALNVLTTTAIIAFSVFEKEAKKLDEFKDATDEAASSIVGLREVLSERRLFTVSGLTESLGASREQLKLLQEFVAEVKTLDSVSREGVLASGFRAGLGLGANQSVVTALTDEQRKSLDLTEQQRRALNSIVEEQEKILAREEALVRVREILDNSGQLGATLLDRQLDTLRNQNTELEQQLAAFENIGFVQIAFAERNVALNREEIRLRKEGAALDAREFTMEEELTNVRIDTAQKVRRAAQDQRVELERVNTVNRLLTQGEARREARMAAVIGFQEVENELLRRAAALTTTRQSAERRLDQIRRTTQLSYEEELVALEDQLVVIQELVELIETKTGQERVGAELEQERLEIVLEIKRTIEEIRQLTEEGRAEAFADAESQLDIQTRIRDLVIRTARRRADDSRQAAIDSLTRAEAEQDIVDSVRAQRDLTVRLTAENDILSQGGAQIIAQYNVGNSILTDQNNLLVRQEELIENIIRREELLRQARQEAEVEFGENIEELEKEVERLRERLNQLRGPNGSVFRRLAEEAAELNRQVQRLEQGLPAEALRDQTLGQKFGTVIKSFTDEANDAIRGEADTIINNTRDTAINVFSGLGDIFRTNVDEANADVRRALQENNKALARERLADARKNLETSKRFAIAEATINVLAGATHALRAPFPISLIQMGTVLAAGFAQVRRIRNMRIDTPRALQSSGGGGGGFGSARSGALGSAGIATFTRPRADLGPLVPFDRGSGSAPAIPVELTVVPGVIPNGDIVISVEQGLQRRGKRGGSSVIRTGLSR